MMLQSILLRNDTIPLITLLDSPYPITLAIQQYLEQLRHSLKVLSG
ncbi:MAG: hypothetical protein QY310_16285 [Candidatus Jettenia sp. CY-1]|nr:MAG: hypothetical protein QY310_16285 [Candidatus Jettenia sp. CY-1]